MYATSLNGNRHGSDRLEDCRELKENHAIVTTAVCWSQLVVFSWWRGLQGFRRCVGPVSMGTSSTGADDHSVILLAYIAVKNLDRRKLSSYLLRVAAGSHLLCIKPQFQTLRILLTYLNKSFSTLLAFSFYSELSAHASLHTVLIFTQDMEVRNHGLLATVKAL